MMNKLVLSILPLVLFSGSILTGNAAVKVTPKSFRQITYLLDTINKTYEIRELRNITELSLNENSEINTVVQTNFSFDSQEGNKSESVNIYSPISHYSFSFQSESDTIPVLLKYFNQTFKDTLITDQAYRLEYNNNSHLISFTDDFAGFQIYFNYDKNGQWRKITKCFSDVRSGHISYEITEREIQYTDEAIPPVNMSYLSMNGVNIFEKKKRNIIDYYVLLLKAGIFNPDNPFGEFDVSNGFFESQDEGTGAGVYTTQLALFRMSDGKDILAINGYYFDPGGLLFTINGDSPKFYLFEKNSFTELGNIFPDVNIKMFFDDGSNGPGYDFPCYFTLPREGLSIQYNLPDYRDFCEKLDRKNENYLDFIPICDSYSNLRSKTIEIAFDKVSGTFYIKEPL